MFCPLCFSVSSVVINISKENVLPLLTVKQPEGNRIIPFQPGRSLKAIFDDWDIPCRAGCRGTGACGLCLVRIESGRAGEPTPNERLHLDEAKLNEGVRLACQVMPEDDLEVTVLATADRPAWQHLPRRGEARVEPMPQSPSGAHFRDKVPAHGVAVDLGTTHIRLSVIDLCTGRRLTGRHGLNPQAVFGADVITRLGVAAHSRQRMIKMQQLVLDALGGALWDIAIKEGFQPKHVTRVCIVGNTAMLALLAARNADLLLRPYYWSHALDCAPEDTKSWALAMGISPEATIEPIPPLAGFVGSDLPAGVLETNLMEGDGAGLFVDFGTNSEIALWDGRVLWVTSAAGGPAFEGSGTSCGVPGEPGAVWRVRREGDGFHFDVMGNREPHGICGTGFVDLIAGLLRAGLLTSRGRFSPAVPDGRFVLVPGKANLGVTRSDVDLFQRAKAALGAGIQILATEAGIRGKDLRRICVGGVFGRHLDIANAREVGLLPRIHPDRVELIEESALAGCEKMLLFDNMGEPMTRMREQAKMINLSRYAHFEEVYLDHLFLRPFEVF